MKQNKYLILASNIILILIIGACSKDNFETINQNSTEDFTTEIIGEYKGTFIHSNYENNNPQVGEKIHKDVCVIITKFNNSVVKVLALNHSRVEKFTVDSTKLAASRSEYFGTILSEGFIEIKDDFIKVNLYDSETNPLRQRLISEGYYEGIKAD